MYILQIDVFLNEECREVYDQPVFENTNERVQSLLEGWLQQIFSTRMLN